MTKYYIKVVSNGWWVAYDEISITKTKRERKIYTSFREAEEYIGGTNVWGDLEIIREKNT